MMLVNGQKRLRWFAGLVHPFLARFPFDDGADELQEIIPRPLPDSAEKFGEIRTVLRGDVHQPSDQDRPGQERMLGSEAAGGNLFVQRVRAIHAAFSSVFDEVLPVPALQRHAPERHVVPADRVEQPDL